MRCAIKYYFPMFCIEWYHRHTDTKTWFIVANGRKEYVFLAIKLSAIYYYGPYKYEASQDLFVVFVLRQLCGAVNKDSIKETFSMRQKTFKGIVFCLVMTLEKIS